MDLGNFRCWEWEDARKRVIYMYKRNKYFILFHIIYINDDKIHTSHISAKIYKDNIDGSVEN